MQQIRYHPTRVIGEGHYSTVFACVDPGFAIKYYKKAKYFHNERDIYLALGPKPYMLTLYDSIEEQRALIFECCECDLFAYTNGQHNRYQAWLYLCNMASAVEDLHSEGVIHGDVKPENILIRDNRAYLCDYSTSSYGEIFKYRPGTWGYMPPATYNDDVVDCTTDYWGFAVTALETLCDISFIPYDEPELYDSTFAQIMADSMLEDDEQTAFACDVAIDRMFNPESQWGYYPLSLRLVRAGFRDDYADTIHNEFMGALWRDTVRPTELMANLDIIFGDYRSRVYER